jgi:hypothetical protein
VALLDKFQILLPKSKGRAGGTAQTTTFRPGTPIVPTPSYRQHTNDLFVTRIADDSRTLLNELFRHDPDVSSAVFAFSAISASSPLVIKAYNLEGELDVEGMKLGYKILDKLFNVYDYTLGYNNKLSLKQFLDDLRYSTMLRGATGFELIVDKQFVPDRLRMVDMATVEWVENKPGEYKPQQRPPSGGDPIKLDIPTFFTTSFHQNPTDIYAYSPFVSVINTVAARTSVINELYRIMQVTGYPRLDITVLEDLIMQHAPANLRADPEARQKYVDAQLGSIRTTFANIRSDQAFIHTNGVEAKMINDKNPGAAIQIKEVIDTLDAQNQAALKTMPSVVGKGVNANTASTESRLFAMNCDSLNGTIAAPLSEAFTLAARIAGFQGRIEISFAPIELRPVMELEPQLTMKSSRLKQDLSLGIITDEEYHLAMYNRPPPAGAAKLSGTLFLEQAKIGVDESQVSPNDDPMGAGLTPPGSENAKSKRTRQGETGPKASFDESGSYLTIKL